MSDVLRLRGPDGTLYDPKILLRDALPPADPGTQEWSLVGAEQAPLRVNKGTRQGQGGSYERQSSNVPADIFSLGNAQPGTYAFSVTVSGDPMPEVVFTWNGVASPTFIGWPSLQQISIDGGAAGMLTINVHAQGPGPGTLSDDVVVSGQDVDIDTAADTHEVRQVALTFSADGAYTVSVLLVDDAAHLVVRKQVVRHFYMREIIDQGPSGLVRVRVSGLVAGRSVDYRIVEVPVL